MALRRDEPRQSWSDGQFGALTVATKTRNIKYLIPRVSVQHSTHATSPSLHDCRGSSHRKPAPCEVFRNTFGKAEPFRTTERRSRAHRHAHGRLELTLSTPMILIPNACDNFPQDGFQIAPCGFETVGVNGQRCADYHQGRAVTRHGNGLLDA